MTPAPGGSRAAPESVSVIVVCYRTPELDLRWVPESSEVLVVHNDDTLLNAHHPNVRHLGDGTNIGFGAGVNFAAREATGERLVIVNPDMSLTDEHFDALAECTSTVIGTVPMTDGQGVALPAVNRYPSPLDHIGSFARIGRLAPLGSRRRRAIGGLTRFGRAQGALDQRGTWPLRSHWVSGAIVTIDRGAFLEVGGFDEGYFLYFEDVDLCQRLPRVGVTEVIVCNTSPAIHHVGMSTEGRRTEQIRRRSALTYAERQTGRAWRAAHTLLRGALRVVG